jgi:glycosyltransferase involved in cell wall biosynthesis
MYRRAVAQVLDFVPNGKRSMDLFLLSLAARLRDKGWCTVHVFAGEPSDDFRKELTRLGSPYLVAQIPLGLGEARDLGRRLRPYRLDAIQTSFLSVFSPALLMLKKTARARRLVFADHTSGVASRKSPVGRLLARLRGAVVSTYVEQRITVSDFVRNREIHDVYLSAHKVRTIYNGVDVNRYVPGECPTNAAFTIGFAGQLIPEKGVHTLLRAIRELQADGAPPVRALIAGTGRQEAELKQFCIDHDLKDVEFLGHIDWVPRLLGSVDVAVIPSEWEEAFAFANLEAMACGACVVVSDAGGNPEAVGRDGDAGAIFRKGDAGDLKRTLRELMADPARRDRMRRAARERAVSRFSLQRMVDDYVAFYDELDSNLN